MNYDCPADLVSDQDLTVDAVTLFQRFRQDSDLTLVETLFAEEFKRHLRLCELAIALAAESDFYWAELPHHMLHAVNVAVVRHLEEAGFVVEFRRVAREEELPKVHNERERIKVMSIESAYVAKWLTPNSQDSDATGAEWRRREALEDIDLNKNPPLRQSRGSGDAIESGDAAWAAVLDGKYVVEIQRLYRRSFLCLFAADGKLLHIEPTNVAYGAMFGPDMGDVAMWAERAQQIVERWRS